MGEVLSLEIFGKQLKNKRFSTYLFTLSSSFSSSFFDVIFLSKRNLVEGVLSRFRNQSINPKVSSGIPMQNKVML